SLTELDSVAVAGIDFDQSFVRREASEDLWNAAQQRYGRIAGMDAQSNALGLGDRCNDADPVLEVGPDFFFRKYPAMRIRVLFPEVVVVGRGECASSDSLRRRTPHV